MAEQVVTVSLAAAGGDADDELRSLLRWLRHDETLHDAVRGQVAADGAPRPGAMGGGLEILQLVIGSGLSGAALAVSVLQWRDARRTRPVLTLRRGPVTVEIPADGAADTEAVRRIVRMLEEGAAADDTVA
ncbi:MULTISPECIES: hypothetical protein [Streptomyces]|uniref:Uncharacterized protein n=1 Tax=Streptomyces lycii TaxID=2654337 RepID=A0ABQ7FG69_9ACTN|nr:MULTISPECIES: hypothetical protein [Streptomyces]KAF4407553.1 hypothetical protein GCU69_19010 [Streptomyces lycii]PGH51359.1 hypothetical protein CRI70_07000 [Streptomyces sp. Ru87]